MSNRRDQKIIINFHGIGEPDRAYESGEELYWISVAKFDAILDILARDEYRPQILITFDDGNASDFNIALPRLLARGLSARFFVLAGKISTPGYLNVSALKQLLENGMGLGSHGYDHVDWTTQSDKGLRTEIFEARNLIEEVTGTAIRQVAIPFGKYNRRVLKTLKHASFDAVYTSDGGSSRIPGWLQPRTSIKKDTSNEEIETLLKSGIGRLNVWNRNARMLLKGWR